MELAVVTDRWDEGGGGRERYLAELVAYACLQQHAVQVFCFETRAGRGSVSSGSAVVHVFKGRHSAAELQLRRAVSRYRMAHPGAPVLAARPVAGATHYQLHSGLYRHAFAAERESIESPLRRRLYWPAMRLNLRRRLLLRTERLVTASDEVQLLVFSDAQRLALERELAVPAHRIHVMRFGIDLRRFHSGASPAGASHAGASHAGKPGRQDPRALRLLFAAHNFKLKGLQYVFPALAEIRRSGIDATLVVAGDGPVSQFRRLASRSGVEALVRFMGAVDQDRLAAIYRESDALVHPTFYDPFPRVIVEALASGCPVVTTRRCGAAEIITPGQEGFLMEDPRDIRGLVEALRLLSDTARLAALRANASVLGQAFRFETHAERMLSRLGLPN